MTDGANSHVQMGLAPALGCPNALFHYMLCLLDKLAMQIDCVAVDTPRRVVLAEDEFAGLPIVLVHQRAVPLAFFGKIVRGGAIAAFVGLVGLCACDRLVADNVRWCPR